MTITDRELESHYHGAIDWLHSPSNEGLTAIAAMAVLIWEADAGFQATRAQIEKLALGPRPDPLIKKRFNGGLQIARLFKRDGVPEAVVAANSFDSARAAVMAWLALQGIRSQDEMPKLSGFAVNAPKGEVERLSKQIAGALRNRDWLYRYSPAEFAKAIVDELTLEQAEEFSRAATEAVLAKKPV